MNKDLLDISYAKKIDIPILEKTDNNVKPKEYWDLFNKGEWLYKKKDYIRAKETFLKVLKFPNPHQAFNTYLLRTYRKIINLKIENKAYNEAYYIYKEFFKVCSTNITNMDRRKFNKLVKNLIEVDPKGNFHEVELVDDPDIKIVSKDDFIQLGKETRFKKDNDPRIRNWDILSILEFNTLYCGSIDNNFFYKVRDYNGDLRSVFNSIHSIYRFDYSDNSDKFIVSSEDLVLYLYSINNGLILNYNLESFSNHKYHLRCISISPDGEFILFTSVDQAYLMNIDLTPIGNWSVPINEGYEIRRHDSSIDYSEFDNNLAILGLNGKPELSEIKKTFKTLVLRYHPDKNPNNPEANAKMKQIINAYEYLTGETAEKIMKESGAEEFYYKVMFKTEVEIPNTGLSFTIEAGTSAGAEDWIYATYLDSNANEIYLGCYSGKIYCFSKEGTVKKIYNCQDVIRSIKKRYHFLYIKTDFYLYILKDDKYLNHLNIGRNDLIWINSGFILKNSTEIKFFNEEGVSRGSIKFKNRIHDLYLTNNGINISTTNKTYEIILNFQKSDIFLSSNETTTSELSCSSCEAKNPYYSIFCQECGKQLKTLLSPR